MRDAKHEEELADPRMLQILITKYEHFEEKERVFVDICIDAFAPISFISSHGVADKRRKKQSGVLPACSHKACFHEGIGAHVLYEKVLAWKLRSTHSCHVWGLGPWKLVSTLLKRFSPLLELGPALN